MPEAIIGHLTKIENIVQRISVRGMTIGYMTTSDMCPAVFIWELVPDAENENRWVQRQCAIRLDPSMSEKEIIVAVHNAVVQNYIHEANELFRFDGKAIYNPHKEREI